jgi:hypothetical protein
MSRFRNSSLSLNCALSNVEIGRIAPSIFAEAPIVGVSDRYTFLPTGSILDGMRSNGWLPVAVDQQRVRRENRRGFQKHLIRFQRAEHIGTTIENRPEVVLLNSHDKSSAYQLHAGIFRFVCSNGMILADSVFESISIKHYGFNPDSVIEGSFKILDSMPQLMDSVEEMRSIPLTLRQRLAFAAGALALKWEDPENAPIRPEKVLEPRRSEDARTDLYTCLNTVQENLIQGGQKDYGKRKPDTRRPYPRTRGVKAIDENVKLNKALWHMAQVLKGEVTA